MNKKIILRADGNATIGLGHVYRLLALADMLRDDFHITFAITQPDDFLKTSILQYAHEIIEMPDTFTYTFPSQKKPGEERPFDLAPNLTGSEIVVTDGYWFGSAYQQAVKKTGAKLVCIDDFAENYFFADAVINHAPGVSVQQYIGQPFTKFYLGLDYALIRKTFFKSFPSQRNESAVLIGLGGSDPNEITVKAIEVSLLSDLFNEIHVIVSPLFTEKLKQQLRLLARQHSHRIFLHQHLESVKLAALMDACTFAIVSASTMLIECYSRGLICFTGYFTGNQLNIYNGFVKQELAYGWGDFNNFEVNARTAELSVSFKVRKINQLRQPLNTIANIQSIFKNNLEISAIHIRKATMNDCRLIFDWANDTDVRKNSIKSEIIGWNDHQSWYEKKINSPDAHIFIMEVNHVPVGQIRFELLEGNWNINYSISKNYRGKGYGKLIISKGIQQLPDSTPVIAYVKPDNIASLSVFDLLGFKNGGIERMHGNEMIKYSR